MSHRTHVWLLYHLAPVRPVPPFWPWIAALLAWLRIRPRLALPGPPDPAWREAALAQALLLDRRLGDSASCRAVFAEGDPSAEEAAGGVGARDAVLLLPMVPQVGPGAQALIAAARAAVARKGSATVVETFSLSQADAVEAQAERVRAALADLPPGAAYEVIFTAEQTSEEDPTFPALAAAAAGIARAVRLLRPFHVVPLRSARWRGSGLARRLAEIGARGVSTVVVVPLNAAIETPDLRQTLDALLPVARAVGTVTVVCAPPSGSRPTFIRGLVAAVALADPDAVGTWG